MNMFAKSTATFDIRKRYRYDRTTARLSLLALLNFPAGRNPEEWKRVGMRIFDANDVDRLCILDAGDPIAAR
jgi:hypothetical protein